ncbi:MAG: tRNA lysidine(34) synthetase TilS [Hyphomonadaceae bacterium]
MLAHSDAISGPVLLALSGGGDSTALLHLLAERMAGRVSAAIVDHAIRPGSEEDAARAAAAAEAQGVAVRVIGLSWRAGEKHNQAALRRARHAALAAAAHDAGARVIALAHTADDQAETMLMRAARTGEDRAQGMRVLAPSPVWPEGMGLTLWRPLLDASRAALRAYLNARGATWIDDPSNDNLAYERIRARRALTGAEARRLLSLARDADVRAAAREEAGARWIAAHAVFDQGEVAFPHAAAHEEGAAPALAILIAAVSGEGELPSMARAEALAARLGADLRGATLGGARIRRRGARIVLSRDPGAVLGRAGKAALAPFPLPLERAAIWDGRLALTAREPGWRAAPESAGAAIIVKAAQRLTLGEAEAAGILAVSWLPAARVRHLLAHSPGLEGVMLEEGVNGPARRLS